MHIPMYSIIFSGTYETHQNVIRLFSTLFVNIQRGIFDRFTNKIATFQTGYFFFKKLLLFGFYRAMFISVPAPAKEV